MTDPDPNKIQADPATVTLVIVLLLLVPLLMAGFLFQ
jgi:hypothetical protein